jgi:hypothetical protein
LKKIAERQFVSGSAIVKQAVEKHFQENGIDWRKENERGKALVDARYWQVVAKLIWTLIIPILLVLYFFPKHILECLTLAAVIVALFKDQILSFYLRPQLKIYLAEGPKYIAEVGAISGKTGQVVDIHAAMGVIVENVGLRSAENVSVLFNGIDSNIVKDIKRYQSLPLIRSWSHPPQTILESLPPNTPIRFSICHVAKSVPDEINFSFVLIPTALLQIKCPVNTKSTFKFEIKAISDNSKAASVIIEIEFMATYTTGLNLNLRKG